MHPNFTPFIYFEDLGIFLEQVEFLFDGFYELFVQACGSALLQRPDHY